VLKKWLKKWLKMAKKNKEKVAGGEGQVFTIINKAIL